MRDFIIKLFFISIVLTAFYSQSSTIEQANKLYIQSRYNEAIAIYQNLIKEGYVGVDLYYNIGNAYYKSDDLAHAILYYEKALKLDPLNEDVLHNLEFAKNKTIDKIEYPTTFFIYNGWIIFTQLFNVDTWAILGIVFFLFSLISLAMISTNYFVNKIRLFVFSATSFVICLVFTFASFSFYMRVNTTKNAIVTSSTISIKSAPDIKSKDLFILHEGTKVEIENVYDNWLNIRIPNGSEGWIEKESLEII